MLFSILSKAVLTGRFGKLKASRLNHAVYEFYILVLVLTQLDGSKEAKKRNKSGISIKINKNMLISNETRRETRPRDTKERAIKYLGLLDNMYRENTI